LRLWFLLTFRLINKDKILLDLNTRCFLKIQKCDFEQMVSLALLWIGWKFGNERSSNEWHRINIGIGNGSAVELAWLIVHSTYWLWILKCGHQSWDTAHQHRRSQFIFLMPLPPYSLSICHKPNGSRWISDFNFI
jgi:hypothetical protein